MFVCGVCSVGVDVYIWGVVCVGTMGNDSERNINHPKFWTHTTTRTFVSLSTPKTSSSAGPVVVHCNTGGAYTEGVNVLSGPMKVYLFPRERSISVVLVVARTVVVGT